MDVCQHFEQHPQRKLCKNCRHPQEDHSFDEICRLDIQEHIETLADDCGAAEPESNEEYSWIPPEFPENRLEEYFKHFPEEKVQTDHSSKISIHKNRKNHRGKPGIVGIGLRF